MVAEVKALACELPARLGLPLSRFSRAELRRYVLAAGIVAAISGVTIWRWLHEDALRSWSRRSWIFPRDPEFAIKAGCVLDLYHRRWHGRALTEDEFVISADGAGDAVNAKTRIVHANAGKVERRANQKLADKRVDFIAFHLF